MTLQELDYLLFEFINHDMANIVLDIVCPLLREKLFWVPVYILIAYFLYMRYGTKTIWLLALAGLTILISDQLSATIIKPYVHRLRPCNNPEMKSTVRLLVSSCGSGYSFVSSHATNHFALSAFLAIISTERKKWFLPLFLWAFGVGFSQVYVGLHYPADVLGGAVLGVIIGTGMGLIGMQLKRIYF